MAGLSWADVSDDLLVLLAERIIGVASFIRFSAVCKPWHMVASSTECCRSVPWLLMPTGDHRYSTEYRDFYDHSTREVYKFALPHVDGYGIVGSAHGWLITADKHVLHLLNPITGTQTSIPHHFSSFFKATCSPIGPNGDCIVALTYLRFPHCLLSFCRPNDKHWTDFQKIGPLEVAYVGGAFYVVTITLKVYLCDFSTLKLIHIANIPRDFQNVRLWKSYIVECADDILVVVKYISKVVYLRVFKLDMRDRKVVEVKSIGDYALFVGINNSLCLSTTSNSQHIFRQNCIYFFNDDREREDPLEDCTLAISIFDLEDGSLKTLYKGGLLSHWKCPTWVVVNFHDLPQMSLST